MKVPFRNPLRRPEQALGPDRVAVAEAPEGYDLRKLLVSTHGLVTGAAGNIGASIARELVAHGARVFCTDIDESVTQLGNELARTGAESAALRIDISDPQQVDDLVAHLDEHGVEINLLVNNVGIGFHRGEAEERSVDETFRRVFDTNLFGPLRLTRAVADRMISRQVRGTIIFISSIHQWTIHGRSAYSASKAAIGMVVNELALELGRYGVRVNAIAPGWVALDDSGTPLTHNPTPLHRSSIPPQLIGRAVVHLAADYFSSHTTGEVTKIDGGLSLVNYLKR